MLLRSSDLSYFLEEVATIGAQAVSGINQGYAVRQVICDGEVVFETELCVKMSFGVMQDALSSAKSAE